MKICTVILTYDTPLYNFFDNIKRKYLQKTGEDFYFIYNGVDESRNNLQNREINYFSNEYHPSGIPVMFNKFLKIINEGLLSQYDYILRVNSSTFINIDNIKKIINSQPDINYGGFFADNWTFCSGAFSLFSQYAIQRLAEQSTLIASNREDDVVIGDLMIRAGISKTFIPRYNFSELTSTPTLEAVAEGLQYPQIRIRNDFNRDVIDRGIWSHIEQILDL